MSPATRSGETPAWPGSRVRPAAACLGSVYSASKGPHGGRRLPDRARLDGRGPRPGPGQVAGADPAGGRELPDLRPAASSASSSRALAAIKGAAAAKVNAELGRARRRTSPTAISAAAAEVARGRLGRRTSRSTSSRPAPARRRNMNTNEVIATLATERLGRAGAPERPRQRLAVVQRRLPLGDPRRRDRRGRPRPDPGAASTSRRRWRARPTSSPTVVKCGRTHLMDATPVTLGPGVRRLRGASPSTASSGCRPSLPRLGELPLGGTAVGTGINTPPGFAAAVIAAGRGGDRAAADRGARPLRGAGRARRARRGLRAAAHDRRRAGQDRQRPALDGLRPAHRAGRDLPARPAAGLARSCRARSTRSSPRPPCMVAAQVIGNDAAVAFAGAAGNFELNVMLPVHGPQRAGVDPAAGQRLAGCWPTAASTGSPPTSSAAASWPSPHPRSSRR